MIPKVVLYSCLIIGWSRVRCDAPVSSYLPPSSGGSGGHGFGGHQHEGGVGTGINVGGGHSEGGFGGGYGISEGGAFGGSGSGGDEEGKPEPFRFSYEVKDPESGNDYSHKAESDGNTVRGVYNVILPDGRKQIVTYTAGSQGYNAEVQYEGEANTGGGFQAGSFNSDGGGSYNPGGSGFPSGSYSSSAEEEPTGSGIYPSGGGAGGSTQGYQSGHPNSNYLPPGK